MNLFLKTILSIFSIAFYTGLAETAQEAAQTAQPQAEAVIEVLNLTDENFNNYVMQNGTNPWIVMFFAPWCPHCKHALPAFGQLSKDLEGQANVAKVDCDANPTLRSRFSVGGYPTFLLFKEGMMYQFKGPRNVESWTNFVNEGYKSVEGEVIPLEASMIKNISKEFKRFYDQLSMLAKQRPLFFGGILGGFVLLVVLTCFCGSDGSDKVYPQGEEEQKNQTDNKKQD